MPSAAAGRRDREGGVVVGVGPVQGREGAGGGLLERDVEQQPAPALREEVLERLGSSRRRRPPSGRSRRPPGARPAGRLWGVRALAGAEVAADRALGADLGVGHVRRAGADRGGERDELRDRRRRADRDSGAVAGDAGEPGAGQEHRLLRAQPRPLVSSGTTIVPPPITVTPASKRDTASSGEDG